MCNPLKVEVTFLNLKDNNNRLKEETQKFEKNRKTLKNKNKY